MSGDRSRAHFAPVAMMPDPAPRPVTADARDRPEDAGHDRVEMILPNGRRLVVSVSTEAAVLARLIQVLERA